MQTKDDIAAELPATPLVGLARIGIAIAEDDAPLIERGPDHFRDGLSAIGEHQPELSHRGQVLGAGVEDERADAIAQMRASGLAGDEDREPLGLKVGGELADLCGFTGTIRPFEGKKKAAR